MDVPKFIAAAAVIGSLDGAITYNASSLLVAGDVSGWPSSDFHVKIEDEIIHVGTRSGQTHSTLTRGALDTDDNHHPNGADVVYVKTADDFVANGNGGSLPDDGTTGQVLVKVSDASGDATWVSTVKNLTLIPPGVFTTATPGEVFDLGAAVVSGIAHLQASHSGGDTAQFYIQLYVSRTADVDGDGYLADSLSIVVPVSRDGVFADSQYPIEEKLRVASVNKDYLVVLPRYIQANLFMDSDPTIEGEICTITEFTLDVNPSTLT